MYKHFVGIFCIIFVFADVAKSTRQNCSGKKFATIGTKEYRLFDNKTTYDEATRRCQAWGENWLSEATGKLVSILSSDEQLCINEMVSSSHDMMSFLRHWGSAGPLEAGYYFGATDPKEDGKWIWQDKRKVQYSNWVNESLQKNAGNGKTCAQMMLRNGTQDGVHYSVGEWLKTSCADPKFYICEREINPSLNWGYESNDHAVKPSQWHTLPQYSECGGSRQSPINFPVTSVSSCNESEGNLVRNYKSRHDTQWEAENTGRFIRIKPLCGSERSMWASFYGSKQRQYIDHMVLKWGRNASQGSDHVVGGTQYAGELQIFFRPINDDLSGEVQAISYLIEEDPIQTNRNWNSVINAVHNIRRTHQKFQFQEPRRGINRLLMGSRHDVHDIAFHYRGSLPHPPCNENVIWTVYSRPIRLSHSQFSVLRELKMEGGESNLLQNFRPVQSNTEPVCSLER